MKIRVLQSSSPQNLASLSTLQRLNLEARWGWGGGSKPHFLHTFYRREHRGIYRRSKAVLWPKIGCVRPTCQAGQPCNLAGGQVSSLHHLWALDTLSTAFAGHADKMVFGNEGTHGRPAKVMWPTDHTLARLSPCFVPHHFFVSYFL
jgi:hypothetical protein